MRHHAAASLPGLAPQTILFRKKMDARVNPRIKPGDDEFKFRRPA